MKQKQKTLSRRVADYLARLMKRINNPILIIVGLLLATVFGLAFAFAAHGLFVLDIVFGLILKAFITRKAVMVRHKRKTSRKPVKASVNAVTLGSIQ